MGQLPQLPAAQRHTLSPPQSDLAAAAAGPNRRDAGKRRRGVDELGVEGRGRGEAATRAGRRGKVFVWGQISSGKLASGSEKAAPKVKEVTGFPFSAVPQGLRFFR